MKRSSQLLIFLPYGKRRVVRLPFQNGVWLTLMCCLEKFFSNLPAISMIKNVVENGRRGEFEMSLVFCLCQSQSITQATSLVFGFTNSADFKAKKSHFVHIRYFPYK